MKYTLATKKKKPIRKRQLSPASPVGFLPSYHLPGPIKGFSNDHLLYDYQYPQTIRHLFDRFQKRRLETLFSTLTEGKISDHEAIQQTFTKTCSQEGCLRWVYQSNYINDGQERFEASNDVSFDVRGQFCADCELARRLVEMRPIIYDTPEPEKPALPYEEGYTKTQWTWGFRPLLDKCLSFDLDPKLTICELSSDLFLHLLSLVNSILPEDFPLRRTCYTFRCGNGLVDVSETMTHNEFDNLDMQEDILTPLHRLSEPIPFEGGTIRLILSDMNPFVTEGSHIQECFYNPHLKLNVHSRAMHSMAIKFSLPRGGRTMLFHCPPDWSSVIDYRMVRELDVYPDIELYYPFLLFNTPNFIRVFVYSVMFLMERRMDTFKTIVSNPDEFHEICQGIFGIRDTERFRNRLLLAKPKSEVTFPQCMSIIRNCMLGLRLYTE